MAITTADVALLDAALELAARGPVVDPNPRVGCVLVNDGAVVGRGFHRGAGTPHAEASALADAGEKTRGATAFVTLEPCNHHGRTPACAGALIDAGVVRVVYAAADPSPEAIPALLAERGVAWTDLDGWHRLDEHEIALGAPHGRARIKVVDRDEMVRVSRAE